jgi:hypothetical protein
MDLSWLWGGNGTEIEPGSFGKSRPFPSKEDLEFARKNDAFRYEGEYTPNTFQVENKQVEGPTELIRMATQMNALDRPTDQDLIDTLARNKLASRRSAIVSLAANDPNDQVVGAKDFTYSGFAGKTYVDPEMNDPMWSFFGKENVENPSTPTHEAAHRGLYKVAQELGSRDDLSDQEYDIRNFINDPDNNELAVRWLMSNLYNDVERPRMPGKYQQFLDDPNGVYKRDQVEKYLHLIEAIAQKMVHQRKPGGPW